VREQAFGVLGQFGRLVVVGLANASITIPNDTFFTYLQQRALGSYGSRPEHVEQLVKLIRRGRLDISGSVSDILPLSEAAAAVERLERKEGNPIRLILKP
jgi:threonine dehydrogenase-like Zn-dependent dehydrogenase